MKITDSLKEKLFVGFMFRELKLQQRLGKTPNMERAVDVAENDTELATDTIRLMNLSSFMASKGETCNGEGE